MVEIQPSSLEDQPATVRPGGAYIGVLVLILCALAPLVLLVSDVVLALLGFVNLLANAWSQAAMRQTGLNRESNSTDQDLSAAAIGYLVSSTLGVGFLIFAITGFFLG